MEKEIHGEIYEREKEEREMTIGDQPALEIQKLERVTVHLINIQSALRDLEYVRNYGSDISQHLTAFQNHIGNSISRSTALTDAIIKRMEEK